MQLKNGHLYCCILAILCFTVSPAQLRAQSFSENQIKGAFLYKITKFVRWENDKKVNLCFIGEKEDASGETVGKTVASLASKEKGKFEVSRDVNINDIKNCNLLFIGSKAEPSLQDILAILETQPIVTISDISSFTRRGGMFGFFKQDNNVSVELHFQNAKKSGIKVNSALQEMITIIK